ncbi:SET domain-containing protein [Dothidotthia symphoricarpi CBS 119687]|uniref:Ribosomal lysine N-methyltransferase 4 n=1 Tax=Dothidotthia symphoricarpi CBS 119687 TaxID=1392245 RepID=A0A6A6A953_9PLEO|nr:SET domain-containing protein [Dothidotthia symphoricarpi CBS 119687]KAF2128339.1 SET domain-containing protein [Dothidotthia symphoricarpi CBS 119687]
MADFDDASQKFLAWLQQSGAEISPKIKLEDLRHAQAGRGVIATQDIAEHEVLFRIPRSAILSVENSVLSNEIPAATFEMLGPWLSLILVMLYEYLNGDVSNWAPYFSVLPSEFNTLMFWSDDELAELQASAVVHKIGKESANEMFLEQLLPVIKEFAETFFAGDERAKQRAEEMRDERNVKLMHQMGSLIMAYAFDVEPAVTKKDVDEEGFAEEDEDEALPKGMVPLADMLNADADRNNARLFYEAQYLDMKALKPIRAGEEIFNDYGPLPRSDLLRRYGYITDNYTQYDVAEIPMDLVTDLATTAGILSESRLEYLDEHEILDSGYDITASSPFTLQESLSPELIILVETLLLSDEEFDRLKGKGKLPKPERMTSKGTEFVHKIVQTRIAQYATTLDEDVHTSKDEVPTLGEYSSSARRHAMAKAVRVGEKTLLGHAEELLAEMVTRDGGGSKRQREVDEDGDVEMGGTGKKQRA